MHRLPELGKKAIFKDNEGSKGRLNFVVRSAEEIAHIQAEHPSVRFVMQAYIPNSSDLRVLVMDGTTRLVIRRSGTGDSHLNNTSQGGAAEIIDKRTVPAQAIAMAEDAARITKLEVAGVDVMFDDNTGEEYILEVNNAPQISSGSFQQEKVDAYAELIHDLLDKPAQSRKKQTKKAPAKRVIGQVEKVSFPLMNETELYARIDSGAKTSSIWAMEAIERKDGLHVIIGPHSKDKNAHVVFPMYDKVRVTSSNGISQERYRVRMPIRLAGKKFTTSFTLADRSTQVYPVLIGRSALQRRFIVDVQKDMTTEEKLLL